MARRCERVSRIEATPRRLILDVPAEAKIYQWSQLEIAQKYVDGLPQASSIMVCPIHGQSTRDEAQDVARCLQGVNVRRVLLITSDYHTRRALSIFKPRVTGRLQRCSSIRCPRVWRAMVAASRMGQGEL